MANKPYKQYLCEKKDRLHGDEWIPACFGGQTSGTYEAAMFDTRYDAIRYVESIKAEYAKLAETENGKRLQKFFPTDYRILCREVTLWEEIKF